MAQHGTLDEISLAIGGLQADVRNIGGTVERAFAHIKATNEQMLRTFTAHADEDERTFGKLRLDVDELQAFKNRCYGIAAIFGLLGGGGIATLLRAFKVFA